LNNKKYIGGCGANKIERFSFNERAIKSYEKCGFKKEGILRQEIYIDGKYYDAIIMAMLKEEYEINLRVNGIGFAQRVVIKTCTFLNL